MEILSKLYDKAFASKINIDMMLQNFNGETSFEIFKDDTDIIDLFYEKTQEEALKKKPYIDKSGTETDNIKIR